jgi:serine/threonine-protein kinase RsbW
VSGTEQRPAAPPPLLRLTLARQPGSVRMAAARVRASVAELVAHDRLDDLELAVAEAIANAAEHGSLAGSPPVTIEVAAPGDWVRVRVRDAGVGALPRRPLDLCAPEASETAELERGRGLLLICRLLDDVEVHHEPDGRAVDLWLRCSAADQRGRGGPVAGEGTAT